MASQQTTIVSTATSESHKSEGRRHNGWHGTVDLGGNEDMRALVRACAAVDARKEAAVQIADATDDTPQVWTAFGKQHRDTPDDHTGAAASALKSIQLSGCRVR
jgi:hypothetical protein